MRTLLDWIYTKDVDGPRDEAVIALVPRLPRPQASVQIIIRRQGLAAGIATRISCHSSRVTGITTYLQHDSKVEVTLQTAGRESARTNGHYYRRNRSVVLDEVERVVCSNVWN